MHSGQALVLELSAVIVAVTEDQPKVLVVQRGEALPSGPLEPDHRTLELGLRAWVERQTGQRLGYVEQLYTFADRGRVGAPLPGGAHVISLSYLALAQEQSIATTPDASWQNWYSYFPWEDGRRSNTIIEDKALPWLTGWAEASSDAATRRTRLDRIASTFGQLGRAWNDESTLQRFELLYEAGLVPEATRARAGSGEARLVPGRAMLHDHRRILATGIARLRAKIKYRPVVFELMPESFTLSQLQRTVEALAGRTLHTQNFRRFLQQQRLVEETGKLTAGTGGRPAKLMRFRREILSERAAAGTKLPLAPTA